MQPDFTEEAKPRQIINFETTNETIVYDIVIVNEKSNDYIEEKEE